MDLRNRTFEGDVPKLTKWLYTSSGMFRDACYQFVALFLLTFVQFCGLGGVDYSSYVQMYSVISVIVIVLRIWDGVNDPLMGYLIERVKIFKKFGKYRPWIFIGAVLNSITVICMFWILPEGWAYVACFAVFYFLWDFTFTINDIAFWSVLPSLSSNEKIRANLTTTLSIFISIGTFAVGGIVPMLASGNQQATYQVTAIITSVLYLASQVILVIFMKERKEDEEVVAAENDKFKFREIFSIIGKNDQLRASIIAILFYYTGATILTAAGLNYFYFNYGYENGGTYQLYFTIVYAAATLIAQFLFPVMANKFKWKKRNIFVVSGIVTMVTYVGLFCFVFGGSRQFNESYFWLLCLLGFIAFFGQTLMSLILYIYIQDCIDYNEYKYEERRESAIFALRAFTAKIGSSLQQLILWLFLFSGALLTVSNGIANAEREFAGQSDIIIAEATTLINGIEQWQLVVFQVGFALVPMACFIACLLIIKTKYKITEESHENMVKEIEHRKELIKKGLYVPDKNKYLSNKKAKISKKEQQFNDFKQLFDEEYKEVRNTKLDE